MNICSFCNGLLLQPEEQEKQELYVKEEEKLHLSIHPELPGFIFRVMRVMTKNRHAPWLWCQSRANRTDGTEPSHFLKMLNALSTHHLLCMLDNVISMCCLRAQVQTALITVETG